MKRAWTLIAVAVAAMACVWLRDGVPRWIPSTTAIAFGIGISWSPMLAGVGMVVGARIGLSLLGGSLAAWVLIAPLVRGHVGDVGAFLLWPGVGLIVSTTLVSLIWERSSFAGGVKSLLRMKRSRSAALALLILLAAFLVAWRVLHLSPLVAVLALVFALVFASVNVRAAGETDVSPLTQTAQLTQLGVAPLTTSQAAADVGAPAVGSSAASAAVAMSYAFKTGHLLGASPRRQIVAQMIGLVVGTAVVVPAYLLFARVVGVGSTTLPAPAAQTTRLLADVVARGTAALPPHAGLATGIACAVGAALAALARTRASRFLPSGSALGMAFLLPTSFALTIGFGAVIAWLLARRDPRWSENYTPAVAAGAIAGEAIGGLIIAALVALAVLPPPPG
jgi:uncharacterized oligopeptide transporter (OPT) family protein